MKNLDWLELEKVILEREKYLKSGSNVIHLQYDEGVLSDNCISDFECKLKSIGLELSRFNKSGTLFATFDNAFFGTYFIINQSLIGELLKRNEPSEVLEVIKYCLITTWKNINENYCDCKAFDKASKIELKFGLKVKFDLNTDFDFVFSGEMDEMTLKKSMDKIVVFLNEQEPGSYYGTTEYLFFDTKKNRWAKVDTQ